MMKKKDYQKPTMRIVELRHRTQLLTGSVQSTMSAKRNAYGLANQTVNESEVNGDGEWEWN